MSEVQKTDIILSPIFIKVSASITRGGNCKNLFASPAHRGLCNIRKGIHSLNVRFRGLR